MKGVSGGDRSSAEDLVRQNVSVAQEKWVLTLSGFTGWASWEIKQNLKLAEQLWGCVSSPHSQKKTKTTLQYLTTPTACNISAVTNLFKYLMIWSLTVSKPAQAFKVTVIYTRRYTNNSKLVVKRQDPPVSLCPVLCFSPFSNLLWINILHVSWCKDWNDSFLFVRPNFARGSSCAERTKKVRFIPLYAFTIKEVQVSLVQIQTPLTNRLLHLYFTINTLIICC